MPMRMYSLPGTRRVRLKSSPLSACSRISSVCSVSHNLICCFLSSDKSLLFFIQVCRVISFVRLLDKDTRHSWGASADSMWDYFGTNGITTYSHFTHLWNEPPVALQPWYGSIDNIKKMITNAARKYPHDDLVQLILPCRLEVLLLLRKELLCSTKRSEHCIIR